MFLFTCSLYDNTFTEGCPGASICPVKAEHEERAVQADSNEDSEEKAEIVDFAVNKVHASSLCHRLRTSDLTRE